MLTLPAEVSARQTIPTSAINSSITTLSLIHQISPQESPSTEIIIARRQLDGTELIYSYIFFSCPRLKSRSDINTGECECLSPRYRASVIKKLIVLCVQARWTITQQP